MAPEIGCCGLKPKLGINRPSQNRNFLPPARTEAKTAAISNDASRLDPTPVARIPSFFFGKKKKKTPPPLSRRS